MIRCNTIVELSKMLLPRISTGPLKFSSLLLLCLWLYSHFLYGKLISVRLLSLRLLLQTEILLPREEFLLESASL